MNKKGIYIWVGLAVVIGLGALLMNQTPKEETFADLDQVAASIGTKEDPYARFDYEFNQIKSPLTNDIPINIRSKELKYSASIEASTKKITAARTEATWTAAGPVNVGGRSRALVIDATDENTLIAGGVSGGVWKSTDNGQSWERKSDPQFLNSVTAMTQDIRPGNENVWYYGTGELRGNSARGPGAPYRGDGIFKSVDNGESWTQLESTAIGTNSLFNSQFQYVWRIITNHTVDSRDEVFAACYGGILRSSNGGETWWTVLGENLQASTIDLNESVSPFYTEIGISSTGIMFAAMSSFSSADVYQEAGLYASIDGFNWENITPLNFPDEHNRTVMAVKGGDDGTVFFLTDVNNDTRLFKLEYELQGNNLTTTWENRSANIPEFEEDLGEFDTQGGYNMAVAIHPDNDNIVYLGATNIYRSTSGFASDGQTDWIGGYDRNGSGRSYPDHHPDVHQITFIPSDADKMLTLSDGGVHLTTNNQADSVFWISLNNNFVTTQYYTINIQQDVTDNIVLGGLQDNGSYLLGGNSSGIWTSVLGGDGGYTYITRDQQYWYVSFQQSQVYRITLDKDFNRTSFARVDPDGGGENPVGYLFINPYIIDPEFQNVMYLNGGDIIWRNDNLAQVPSGSTRPTAVNWVDLRDTRTATYRGGEIVTFQGQISSMELVKGEPDTLFYGTSIGKLYAVINPTLDDPEVVDLTSSNFPEEGYIVNISANPFNSREMLAIFSNYEVQSVFRSIDGGVTFESISGNLEENPDGSGNGASVRWSEIVPLTTGENIYFVGTSTGLFSTTNLDGDNTVWVKEASDQIGSSVITMMDYRKLDGTLVVATHGNGVFLSEIEDAITESIVDQGSEFMITNVYPNPLDDQSRILFSIPESGRVTADIYDGTGQWVKNILSGDQFAGANQIIWNGTNQIGQPVDNGIYYYRLIYNNKSLSGRIVIDR